MSSKKIYIAEDDIALIELMKVTLGKIEGFEVFTYDNGLEIYKEVQKNPPDFIIMDIILPKLDGLAVTRLLKFHEKYKDIPLLIVSSIIDPDIEERALKAGANEFLRKPFKPAKLKETSIRLIAVKNYKNSR